jgi:hypothetical protein
VGSVFVFSIYTLYRQFWFRLLSQNRT